MRQYRRIMKTLITFILSPTLIRAVTCALILAFANSAVASEAGVSLDGPDVTIIASEERVVYEYRQNGQLRMVRIVPNWGKPYILVPADPTKGYGDLERADSLVPAWTLLEF